VLARQTEWQLVIEDLLWIARDMAITLPDDLRADLGRLALVISPTTEALAVA
jgi:hypothetical protein